ncbi:MAG: response regulator transcription factor [Acidimicrobiia bacterium]|nr:response regulator transcription factor [Acidimicrobiia bacterium]
MKNILLVDDHRLLRQAVKRALIEAGFNIVGEASDGEEGVNLVNELSPEIVILDITMPVMDGLTALKIIKKSKPDTKVIMLTMHGESSVVSQAISLGASGFITKDVPMSEVIDLVARIADGQIMSSEIAQRLLESSKVTDDAVIYNVGSQSNENIDNDLLTKREIEILQLVADGRGTNEIAEDLFISAKTVKNHLASIYEKLDARDRTQAVLTGIKSGIIEIN